MKRVVVFSVVALLAAGLAIAGVGNQLPPGPRYVLNVIAFDQCPAGDFIGSNRHMIAVQADYADSLEPELNYVNPNTFDRTNDILLAQADTFKDIQVLDGNGCDDGGARLALPANPFNCPNPEVDCNADGTCVEECLVNDLSFQAYKVYVRLVGKPKTGIDVMTCGEAGIDADTGDLMVICSTEKVVLLRSTGKGAMKFGEFTKELTTILADVDMDGDLDRVGLFDPALENYFWNWNTSGKAHAQLVFIPIPD